MEESETNWFVHNPRSVDHFAQCINESKDSKETSYGPFGLFLGRSSDFKKFKVNFGVLVIFLKKLLLVKSFDPSVDFEK